MKQSLKNESHRRTAGLRSNVRRGILFTVLPGSLVLTALVWNAGPALSAPTTTFTAYSHTGVVSPRGLAAAGKYVWLTDLTSSGGGAHVVQIDAATGDKRIVASTFVSDPSQVVASRRYAWVMNAQLSNAQAWSLLRINATTLAVQRIKIPGAGNAGIGYTQGPILLAGHYVWIPGSRGILRVNTTTLKASTITSHLILGPLLGVAADAHSLWLNAPTYHEPSQRFFVRVSLATGVVTKVNFPGVKGGFPIGDDGTNLWVANANGIQRVDPATDQVTTVVVPKAAQITFPVAGPSAIANGAIYFCAGLPALHHTGVVRIGISSSLASVVSSPLLYYPSIVATSNGVLWVVNAPYGNSTSVKLPVLVRVSWPSQA
jgi:streptogramin lyase